MSEEGKKIKSGVFWTFLDFISKAGLQFLLQLILAKFLIPEDFGVIGMAVVFTAIIQAFVDFGFGAALIQMKESVINNKYLSTAFWTGLFLSIIIYLIIVFVISPFSAYFFDEPKLKHIFPILSINILVNSFNVIQIVKITREMNFKYLALVNFISNFVALIICVYLAYSGYGYWSIAVHPGIIAITALPLYFIINRWTPEFYWNKNEFKKIFGFGVYTSGTQLTNNITSQIDYLIIGKFIDKQSLGLYSISFQITSILRSSIVGVISKVMYPVYSKIQNDKSKIRNYYKQIVKYNFLIIGYFMLTLILFARFFVETFFSPAWYGAIEIIQILSVSSIISVLASSNTSLIRAMGLPKLEFRIQLFKTIFIYIPSIILGTYFFGIKGTAYSMIVNGFLSVIIAMYFMKKLTGFDYFDLYESINRTLLLMGGGIVVYFLLMQVGLNDLLTFIFYSIISLLAGIFLYMNDILKILKK